MHRAGQQITTKFVISHTIMQPMKHSQQINTVQKRCSRDPRIKLVKFKAKDIAMCNFNNFSERMGTGETMGLKLEQQEICTTVHSHAQCANSIVSKYPWCLD